MSYRATQSNLKNYKPLYKGRRFWIFQNDLAASFVNGRGVPQDYAEAVKWLSLAAAQGDARAQRLLGLRYNKGEDVPQDYVRSHMWLNLVAMKGDVEDVKIRDNIAKLLTPQKMAEAQKLARECQANNFKGC